MSKIDLDQQIAGLAVVLRLVSELVPYAKNSRTHSPKQVEMIAASIREFGFTNPVLTDGASGIIAGHGRVMAAQRLKLHRVPTIDLAHLTDVQKRAYVIADNQLALKADWDEALLVEELGDLKTDDFDLNLLGFEDADLEKLLGTDPDGEGQTDPDEVPSTPVHAVSRPGDMWICGRHRIACGDSTDPAVAQRIGAREACVVVSDPPYGIGYSYESHDDSDNAANAQLVWDAFTLGPDVRIWTPGLPNLARDVARFGKTKVLVWSKKFAAAGSGLGGASTWEPILVAGKPPERKLKNDVIEIMTERVEVEGVSLRKLHTCPKPVALYALLIEAFTPADGAVHEPFSGSGTTLMACETTGRSCFASEYEPKYVDVAVRRWELHTGQQAVLDGDGRTFAAVAEARPWKLVPAEADAGTPPIPDAEAMRRLANKEPA